MRNYHRKEWQKFRKEIIELDGNACVRCKRGPLQGAILQVHHKQYLPGRLPWQYPYSICETLCKGCHASEHGVVKPFSGWECIGHDDLGDVSGQCELCGNSLRHIFFVQHQKWPSMEVGEICCDHLTETSEASDHMTSFRRFETRRKRFIESSRWETYDNNSFCVSQNGIDLAIEPINHHYRLLANSVQGRLRFESISEAKSVAFELIENGKIKKFLIKHKIMK